ncbi:hypothetical protein CASFOL_006385 [Castilleja foliolosa]|uniref:C2H2-type domain-containing protein n=1 Tax=Castilleja foliolosa TaxID=1961234 RepID=A0ABD3E744_9LAMI
MDTEAMEDVAMAAPPLSCLNKGKRTKRQRPLSPIPFSGAAWSDDSTTTEDEDAARCLILLAQGHFSIHEHSKRKTHDQETGTYECKTCNRAFQSFQALGGHRASHKKPRNDKKSAVLSDEEDYPSFRKRRPPSSLQLANISAANAAAAAAAGGGPMKPLPSPRIHECNYCGAEFTSGQALGGHMRRHRAGPNSETKSPRNGLSLDLNLPAPNDENQRFGFAARQQQKSPVLSTSNTPTLVDCHY